MFSSAGSLYCAFRLEFVIGLTVLGVESAEHLQSLAQRHAEFVTCLINGGDARLTYDLRYIAEPAPDGASSGDIRICLLVRAEHMKSGEFERHLAGLYDLLGAQFPEYGFVRVIATEVPALLEPFRIKFLASVQRRCSFEGLDTLASGPSHPPPGFYDSEGEQPSAASSVSEVLHIYPFVPSLGPMRALLKAIAGLTHPLALSIRLRPTKLTPEEERFLEEQIATCEKYSQLVLGTPPEDVSHLRPTLRHQAVILQQYNSRLLFGLRAASALLTIEIAAPEPSPKLLLELVGGSITLPAGGGKQAAGDDVYRYLAGGYDLIELPARVDTAKAFRCLDVCLEAASGMPSAANRLRNVFDSQEASTAFRFPPSEMDELPGVELRMWRLLPPPRGLSEEGVILGATTVHQRRNLVRLSAEDRKRHAYVIGQSGTGKTTALRSMILSDIEAGEGLCVIDPHGDLFTDLLGRIPAHRRDDVVIIDPSDAEWPVGLNPLEFQSENQAFFLAQEFCGIMARLLEDEYGQGALSEFAGPVFFQHLRMNLMLLMSDPERPGTLLDLHALFNEKDYWKKWLPLKSDDPVLKRWVDKVLSSTNYLHVSNEGTSMGGYMGSKLESFVFEPRLRNIFSQYRSTIDMRGIMDEGKILFINLAKGLITEPTSRFLGMVLLSKLIACMLGRADVPSAERRAFTLYVDEFQSIATEGFVTLLSEARKFGINLVLANQFVSQVHNRRILDAVFGNVGTLACFRVGQADAELLEQYFLPEANRQDLMRLPNWRAYLSTMVRGAKVRPFTLETVMDGPVFDENVATAVREGSRRRYSKRLIHTPKLSVKAVGADT